MVKKRCEFITLHTLHCIFHFISSIHICLSSLTFIYFNTKTVDKTVTVFSIQINIIFSISSVMRLWKVSRGYINVSMSEYIIFILWSMFLEYLNIDLFFAPFFLKYSWIFVRVRKLMIQNLQWIKYFYSGLMLG